MVIRKIEAPEIVVIIFDFRTFGNGEAHVQEGLLHFPADQMQRMFMPYDRFSAGQRDIDCLRFDFCRHGRSF